MKGDYKVYRETDALLSVTTELQSAPRCSVENECRNKEVVLILWLIIAYSTVQTPLFHVLFFYYINTVHSSYNIQYLVTLFNIMRY